MPGEQQAKHVTSVPRTFFKFLSISLIEYIGMAKQKQIHKGKIPLEPSPGHIDTKNRKFHITIYESTDTVLLCAFQKKHQYYPNTPTSIDIYKERLQSNIDTSCNEQILIAQFFSQKGKICLIRTIRTRIFFRIWQFCNFQNTFPLCFSFFYIKANFVCEFFSPILSEDSSRCASP